MSHIRGQCADDLDRRLSIASRQLNRSGEIGVAEKASLIAGACHKDCVSGRSTKSIVICVPTALSRAPFLSSIRWIGGDPDAISLLG